MFCCFHLPMGQSRVTHSKLCCLHPLITAVTDTAGLVERWNDPRHRQQHRRNVWDSPGALALPGTPKHGLSSNIMALITSDGGKIRSPGALALPGAAPPGAGNACATCAHFSRRAGLLQLANYPVYDVAIEEKGEAVAAAGGQASPTNGVWFWSRRRGTSLPPPGGIEGSGELIWQPEQKRPRLLTKRSAD